MLKNPVFWAELSNGLFLVFAGFCAGWVFGAIGRTKRARAMIRKWSDEELNRIQAAFAVWFKVEKDKLERVKHGLEGNDSVGASNSGGDGGIHLHDDDRPRLFAR
jgi:hypothetical protein